MKFISQSLDDTEKIAGEFLNNLKMNKNGATVVGLYGDLGSAKTIFVKALAKLLDVKEVITSPTFVIIKRFNISSLLKYQISSLIHIDSYRLESGRELETLGWKDWLVDKSNLILIEWPEKVADVMPENHIKINFKFVDENTREIGYEI